MRSATIALLALLLSVAVVQAADPPSGASQVVLGFTGGAVWTSPSTGICIWYLPLVGDQELTSLFQTHLFGQVDPSKDTAYLIWVSDFSVQMLNSVPPFVSPPDHPTKDWPPPYALAVVPTGTATIYYAADPSMRNGSTLTERSTWGVPIATFTRSASLIRSPDGLASDTFIFSAELKSSQDFMLGGKAFNFKNLIPNGMTCFENGQQGSSWESGVCVTKSAAQ